PKAKRSLKIPRRITATKRKKHPQYGYKKNSPPPGEKNVVKFITIFGVEPEHKRGLHFRLKYAILCLNYKDRS
ncbi:MAG TPA: hypothetical protein DDX91_09980, partial [Ruminococcaceae bacterium]|nr:hypothetical protein [Oscillospiraceae bacterium]